MNPDATDGEALILTVEIERIAEISASHPVLVATRGRTVTQRKFEGRVALECVLAAKLLGDRGHALAQNTGDGQVFFGRLQLAAWAGDGGCAIGRAAARLGVKHTLGGVRNANDDHAEMNEGNHHGDQGSLLAAVGRTGGSEDPGGLALQLALEP